MKTLTPLQTLAITRAVATRDATTARDAVAPGRRRIDVTVRIVGTIDVGEPYEQRLTAAVPWEALATLALDRLNDETLQAVVAAVREAKAEGSLADLVEDAKGRTWALVEGLKDETVREVRGKVNARLVAETV